MLLFHEDIYIYIFYMKKHNNIFAYQCNRTPYSDHILPGPIHLSLSSGILSLPLSLFLTLSHCFFPLYLYVALSPYLFILYPPSIVFVMTSSGFSV